MQRYETLLEGKYNYLKDGRAYSEENFTLKKEVKINGNYRLNAETLTRTRTGEFLKINIEYDLTFQFNSKKIKIERQLGPKSSTELIQVNQGEKFLNYSFKANNKSHNDKYQFSGYLHFATPCFSCSMLMTLMKKIDPVHRTQYTILTSNNIWTYDSKAFEQEVYVELQEMESVTIEIGGNSLKSTYCKLLQVDEKGTIATEGHDIYLSKFHNIPYQGIFPDGVTIEIDTLKSNESKYKNTF